MVYSQSSDQDKRSKEGTLLGTKRPGILDTAMEVKYRRMTAAQTPEAGMAVASQKLSLRLPPLPPTVEPNQPDAKYILPGATGLSIIPDRLGKLIQGAMALLSPAFSFIDLCEKHRGDSCLHSAVATMSHPAAPLLDMLREFGAPVILSSPQWTLEELDQAVQRGAHRSTIEHLDFLRGEFADMFVAGHWLVLPYLLVRGLPGLRLSPTGVVPQRDRRPRTIVDYTFFLVNQSTMNIAPDSLQFGHALLRILQQLHRADTRRGTIYLAKIDVADAFMRIRLALPGLLALGALLPVYPGEVPLVALPMVLPMGWQSSPQYLCAITETIADITNARFRAEELATSPHRLDDIADTKPEPIPGSPGGISAIPPPTVQSQGPRHRLLNIADVFMDDFILCSQLPKAGRQKARRTLFESIDAVIRPLTEGDNPNRKEPNSVKKLLKGDGAWDTRKVILGWLIDTIERTIELPPHRRDRLQELLAEFPGHQKRTSRRKWQQLIGELRSMVLAIPGGRGLFSQLQSVLDYAPDARPSDRIHLTRAVHDQLDDFRWLAKQLSARPTRWGEVVDSDPAYIGAVDASGTGMGGVWLDSNEKQVPLLWRYQFPTSVAERLVSSDNPSGTLTNSDLEQTGLVCHQDILAQVFDVRERTICTLTDNTSALSREQRGSSSVNAPSAYLCRLSAMHQRAYRYRLSPAVANLPPETRDALRCDASTIEATMQAGVSRGRNLTAAVYERIWKGFCLEHQLDPYLQNADNKKVEWLQHFALRVRDGRLSASKNRVRSGTVADALNFVAQTFTFVGLPDPRCRPYSTSLDPRLARQLKCYSKEDPPPTRVKPVPIPMLHHAYDIAHESGDETSLAAADMMWIAFFFLLRPGEYTRPAEDSHPFRISDVRLWNGTRPIRLPSCSNEELRDATFVSLTFSTQKNGTRGEAIGHGRSTSPTACPVRAVVRRLCYLRTFDAPSHTYLCSVGQKLEPISSSHVTALMRKTCATPVNTSSLSPGQITAKSLRASGAMALLNEGVNHDMIQLIGRWKWLSWARKTLPVDFGLSRRPYTLSIRVASYLPRNSGSAGWRSAAST